MKKNKKNKSIINVDAIIGTVFVFILIYLFSAIFSADLFTPLKRVFEDFAITDVNTDLREEESISPDTNIVLVNSSKIGVDETFDLILKLYEFNPKVIGLEKLEESLLSDELRLRLDSIVSLISNKLVIGYTLFDFDKQTNLDLNDTLIKEFYRKYKENLAYNDIDFQKDKRFYTQREYSPSIKSDTGFLKSFAYNIADRYGSVFTKHGITSSYDKYLINFKGNYNKFYFYEGIDLLNEEEPINRFTNKIILIGNCPVFDNDKILDELFFTPLNPNYTGRTFPDMFRIVILANVINMLNEGNFYYSMPDFFIVLIAFFVTYTNFILYLRVSSYKKELYELVSIFAFLIQSILILFITYYFYFTFNIDLKLTLTLIAVAATVFIFEAYLDSVKPFIIYISNKVRLFFKNIFETI